ncbi:MAG TPA: hypothetical protein VF647_23285 [Longimicrobium sp.]|jgi:hypothetical protein
MKRVLVAALILLAGCVDFVDVTSPEYAVVGRTGASVDLDLVQPVEGADSLGVNGWIGVQATHIQFVDDSLRVLGQALRPRPRAQGTGRTYDSTLVVAPGALGAGVVGVTLPVVKGVEFFPAAFRAPVWTRSGPAKLTVARGTDLVLPFSQGASSAELGPAFYEFWRLDLTRGAQRLNISSSGPLPARIVVPAASVPPDSSNVLDVEVTANRGFQVDSRGDSSFVSVFTRSVVRWSVEITP